MRQIDLGTLDYRSAWAEQERIHAQVLAGEEEAVILVEHPPVITFGRRAEDSARNLVTSRDALARIGVDLVESDRGGDITFHGPGQIVAYPIVRLSDHALSVGAYVKTLEQAVIRTLAELGVDATLDPDAIGVWVNTPQASGLSKICALGVRIKRGVSMHGIALNVTTDLSYFNLIVPCGLAGRGVVSLAQVLQTRTPEITVVKEVLAKTIISCFDRAGSEK